MIARRTEIFNPATSFPGSGPGAHSVGRDFIDWVSICAMRSRSIFVFICGGGRVEDGLSAGENLPGPAAMFKTNDRAEGAEEIKTVTLLST
jgi:hypothetical protein